MGKKKGETELERMKRICEELNEKLTLDPPIGTGSEATTESIEEELAEIKEEIEETKDDEDPFTIKESDNLSDEAWELLEEQDVITRGKKAADKVRKEEGEKKMEKKKKKAAPPKKKEEKKKATPPPKKKPPVKKKEEKKAAPAKKEKKAPPVKKKAAPPKKKAAPPAKKEKPVKKKKKKAAPPKKKKLTQIGCLLQAVEEGAVGMKKIVERADKIGVKNGRKSSPGSMAQIFYHAKPFIEKWGTRRAKEIFLEN